MVTRPVKFIVSRLGAHRLPTHRRGAHRLPTHRRGAHRLPTDRRGAHRLPTHRRGAHRLPTHRRGAHGKFFRGLFFFENEFFDNTVTIVAVRQ